VQVLENTRKTLASQGFEPLFCIDMIAQNSMVFDTVISRLSSQNRNVLFLPR
jgi:hypothetical protein